MSEPTSYIVEIDEIDEIGELEFGSFLFLHEKIQGGGSDAAQDENVDLPETD